MLEQIILMILKLLWNTQMIWMIFIKRIEEYNPNKKCKILNFFNYMIADMLSNKKLNLITTELLIRGRKLNTSLVFITESYFAVPKNIGLNYTHYIMIKISNKQEFQGIASNNLSDIDFKDFFTNDSFQKMYRKTMFFFSY